MNVGDGGAVLVHHQLAVLHAEDPPLGPDHGGEVPDHQQTVLAAHNDLPLVDCRTENLGLVFETLDALLGVQVVEVETLVISTDESQGILEMDVPDDGGITVLLQSKLLR